MMLMKWKKYQDVSGTNKGLNGKTKMNDLQKQIMPLLVDIGDLDEDDTDWFH